MIEMLTPLHTATCKHCGEAITMLRGEWRGADWYHDANGALTCPGAPTAWPVDDTIQDVPADHMPRAEQGGES